MNDRIELAKEFAKSIKSYDIKLIVLFGSVARGEDTEESDIDVLIVSPIADEIRQEIIDLAIDIVLDKEIFPHKGKSPRGYRNNCQYVSFPQAFALCHIFASVLSVKAQSPAATDTGKFPVLYCKTAVDYRVHH